jgi:hypothetical protein
MARAAAVITSLLLICACKSDSPRTAATDASQLDASLDASARTDANPPPIEAGSDASLTAGGSGGANGLQDGGMSGVDAGGAAPPIDRGSVRGRVLGLDPADLARTSLIAGAVSTTPIAGGYFFLDGVPVGDSVSLLVRAQGYSTGHARLTVSKDRITSVIVEVKRLATEMITDPLAARTLTFGEATNKPTLELPANALETPYATPPMGPVRFDAATLDARTTPQLSALQGGKLILLRSQLSVEARITQPNAALRLKAKAKLALYVAPGSADLPQLYRFDEAMGSFVRQTGDAYDATTGAVRAEIDQLGTYVVATTRSAPGCVSGKLTDPTGLPVAGAAVRWVDASYSEGGQVRTDAAGAFCLPVPLAAASEFAALGVTEAGGLVEYSNGQGAPATQAAACGGASCVDLGALQTQTAVLGCVRGQIAPLVYPSLIFVKAQRPSDPTPVVTKIHAGDDFCLNVTNQTELNVENVNLSCGKPRTVTAPTRAAACGGDACQDLGTIQCCKSAETCNDGIDDDCDGMIDETCSCGGHDCKPFYDKRSWYPEHCCTATNTCGFHYTAGTDRQYCFDLEATYRLPDSQCASQTVTINETATSPVGCCRADGRCGVELSLVCVPVEELEKITGTPVPAHACTPNL